MTAGRGEAISAKVSGRRWLSRHTFELRFHRPLNFSFSAGQKIGLYHGDLYRDYSLVGSPEDHELMICVRLVKDGALSPLLAGAQVDDTFQMTPAFGQFLYQSESRSAVLVATGTGVAPFVAFARSGVRDFVLLHGVRSAEQRYYHEALAACAEAYVACIPGRGNDDVDLFYPGRVTQYLETQLAVDAYDFYLCGRREMIRDVMAIVDRQFPAARVFTEIFF